MPAASLLPVQVGKMVDCTSYFELEQAEYAAKGITLSVEAWLVKLMVRGDRGVL
jgi:hypothetical protein